VTILLVRHGETVDNASGTFQTPSSELSNNGHSQAVRLSERLVDRDISDIICSDYLRTRQTANHTAEKLGLEPILTELLRERNFGEIRGQAYADLSFDPFALNYHPKNGESWEHFDARVARAWSLINSVSERALGDVLVITHGFVCRSIVANHTALEPSIKLPRRWANTSLTEIQPTPPWNVITLNCDKHLESDVDGASSESGQA